MCEIFDFVLFAAAIFGPLLTYGIAIAAAANEDRHDPLSIFIRDIGQLVYFIGVLISIAGHQIGIHLEIFNITPDTVCRVLRASCCW